MIKFQITTMAILVVFCMLGCAPGPKPTIKRFYEGLREPLEGLDLSGLEARKIVIDPGHGGAFRGARGISGTDEADVNLGVALHLAALLEKAGARVTLTRRIDMDFVGGDSLRLRDDLRARVEIAGKIDPDVFISLHHNADLRRDPAFNEVQVYYKFGDDGPSLDIARAIARHLLQNLGEDTGRIVAGNYYVLRNLACPAVLCEPSFITNPEVENEIKIAEKQWLEAAAYFLGIVDYFSRGVPQIVRVAPAGEAKSELPTIEVVFDDKTIVDVSTVDIRIDDESLQAARAFLNRFVAAPAVPLRGGKHTIRASGRAFSGNASRKATSRFQVHTDPALIEVMVDPEVPAEGYPQKVTALVLDHNCNPVADSTSAVFSWKTGSTTRATRSGRASVFVGRDLPLREKEIAVKCGGLAATMKLGASLPPASPTASRANEKEPSPSQPGAGGSIPHYISGFVVDSEGEPLRGATVVGRGEDIKPETSPAAVDSASGRSAATDEDGFFVIASEEKIHALSASKLGFKTSSARLDDTHYPTIRLDGFYRGLARDISVAIDAEGGGEATGWVGPTGITASNLNLAVAKKLQRLLQSVGINAHVTRESDRNVAKEERVAEVESHPSALLISVAHEVGETQGAVVGRYPTSTGGASLSKFLQEEMKSSFGYEVPVADNAEYVIRQTSCPAVKITFVAPRTIGEDAVLSEPHQVWMRSYALLCSILRFLGLDEKATFSVRGRVTEAGMPGEGVLVIVDGTLETTTDANGEFDLRLLENCPHTARIFPRSGRASSIAFDEKTGSIRVDLD
ncbi:MAG: N-acetylmuramoyl-L-alanine amidase [Candidatus Eisenbacteria bacterium]